MVAAPTGNSTLPGSRLDPSRAWMMTTTFFLSVNTDLPTVVDDAIGVPAIAGSSRRQNGYCPGAITPSPPQD
jgi:hypothetical protein